MGLSNNLGKLSNMITSTGSAVGIAQTSPSYTLDVTGTGRFTGALTADRVLTSSSTTNSTLVFGSVEMQSYALNNSWIGDNIYYNGGFKARATGYTSQIYFNTDGGIGFWTNSGTTTAGSTVTLGQRLLITATGNVGIGTSSPYSKLGVGSSTSTNGEIGLVPDFEGAGEHALISYLSGTGYKNLNIEAGQIRFWTGSSSTTEKMRITSGGAIGINTGSATLNSGIPLNIQATSGGNALFLRGNASHQSNIVFAQNASDTSYTYIVAQGNSTGNMQFYTGDTERMRITSGGQVSVGTSSASATALFYLKAPASSTVWSFGPNNYNATNIFRVENSDTTGLYLTSGNTSWTANSDERLKNITGNIENAIDSLLTLRTVKYSWKKDTSEKVNLGLIAQDVQKVFPEVIDTNADEMLGVRYQELVPVLVKAIQELSAKVSALEAK